MGTAIVLLVSLMLLPGAVKLIGDWQAELPERPRKVPHR